jgi:hypothetical protein
LIFLIQSFEVILITTNFKLNQDFFAEICTNKDKPEMKCHGKCHLKKQIEQSEQNRSEKEEVKTEKEIQIFLSIAILFLPTVHPKISNTLSASTSILPPKKCFTAIFRPPKSF